MSFSVKGSNSKDPKDQDDVKLAKTKSRMEGKGLNLCYGQALSTN